MTAPDTSLNVYDLRWGTAYQSRLKALGDNYAYVDSLWSDVYEFETVAFAKPSHGYAYYPNGCHGVVSPSDAEIPPPPVKVVTDAARRVKVVVGDYRAPKATVEVVIGTARSTKRAWAQAVKTHNVYSDYIMMGGTGYAKRTIPVEEAVE